MPTPLEILLDPVSLAVLALYGALMMWEAARPGRVLPNIPGWRARALVSFVVYFFLSSYLPLIWDEHLARYRVFDLQHLGLAGAAVALLVYETGTYFWHRAMHRSNVLWRAVHQMHHSAERLDAFGAFYFSPWDMVGWTLLGSLCTALLLGLTPQASTAFLLVVTLLGIFQHTNVRTPRWLGYVIQRPESHTVHHARGVHAFNYADLPLFDLLFGTFRNPAGYEGETGFYNGASARVGDMLLCRDVSELSGHSTSTVTPTYRGALSDNPGVSGW